jgi:hypothetical protein
MVGEFSQQQIQKGGLAPSVPAGEAQPPVGVDLEGDIFEDGIIAAFVGEGQIGDRVICTVKRSTKDPQYGRCYSLDLKRIVGPKSGERAA